MTPPGPRTTLTEAARMFDEMQAVLAGQRCRILLESLD